MRPSALERDGAIKNLSQNREGNSNTARSDYEIASHGRNERNTNTNGTRRQERFFKSDRINFHFSLPQYAQ
jgi:hypothetical protein